MKRPVNVAVFASGGGTNLQALIDACASGRLNARICLVVSNNSKAFAFERARKADVPTAHLSSWTHEDPDELADTMLRVLSEHDADMIVLAGYMKLLPREVVAAYPNRILNLHPALLPKHGGAGMYGLRVHEAVLAAGETESGATVHIVDEHYDHGPNVIQRRVAVKPDDTPESLAARVLEVEHGIIVEATAMTIEREFG